MIVFEWLAIFGVIFLAAAAVAGIAEILDWREEQQIRRELREWQREMRQQERLAA